MLNPFAQREFRGLDHYLMSLEKWRLAIPEGCLSNKKILVTGVQHLSIGGALVNGLARHCGAQVIMHSHSQRELDALREYMGLDIPGYVCDFTDPNQAWKMGKKMLEDHRTPWAILGVAGISEYPDITKLAPSSADAELASRIINVNYLSPLMLISALIDNMLMIHRDVSSLPRIICTSSVHSERACGPGNATYAMTKAGQEAIARDMGNDPRYRGRLITAAIQFGWIDVIRHRSNDEIFAAMCKAAETMPNSRIPTASEAALQYAKLCLPDADHFHCKTLTYDSGRTTMWP